MRGPRTPRSPTYQSFRSMLERCYRIKHPHFKSYGGRGITVCDRWRHSFKNFIEDMGGRPDGKTLNRKDNDLGYSKDNCEWANQSEQNVNRSCTRWITFRGETKPLSHWSKVLKMGITTIRERLNLGWSVDEALSLPVGKYAKHNL
jgi:hypothetical protein